MKIKSKYFLTVLVLLVVFVISSCSAPAYQRNKYKSGKRFQDCGCMYKPVHENTALCLNE